MATRRAASGVRRSWPTLESIAFRSASYPARSRSERVEAGGELVERSGDVAKLVGALDAGTHRAVALLEPSHGDLEAAHVPSERHRGEQYEHGGDRRGHTEHARDPCQFR